MKKALILVDCQNDFFEGGALPVPNSNKIISNLQILLLNAQFDEEIVAVIATRDLHPDDTKHFEKWPYHCLAYGDEDGGAMFHPALWLDGATMVTKGTSTEDDGYSGFEGTTDTGQTLEEFLKEQEIEHVLIAGLATDYCVNATALDAVKLFKTTVITNACAAVNLQPEDELNALHEMRDAGVELVTMKFTIKTEQEAV